MQQRLPEHELNWHFRGFLSHKSGHFILYLFIFSFFCFVLRLLFLSALQILCIYIIASGLDIFYEISACENMRIDEVVCFSFDFVALSYSYFLFLIYLIYFIIAQVPDCFLRSNRKCMNPDGRKGGEEVEKETIIKIYCLKEKSFSMK